MANKLPKKLWKTTIVIWSEYDGRSVEIEDLAREAMSGDALCTKQQSLKVDPRKDPDWTSNEFFGVDEE